jgi:FixJ family two-component response regulator
MMTAHSYGAVGRKATAAGCVSFLAKPCGPTRVLQEVMRHVS